MGTPIDKHSPSSSAPSTSPSPSRSPSPERRPPLARSQSVVSDTTYYSAADTFNPDDTDAATERASSVTPKQNSPAPSIGARPHGVRLASSVVSTGETPRASLQTPNNSPAATPLGPRSEAAGLTFEVTPVVPNDKNAPPSGDGAEAPHKPEPQTETPQAAPLAQTTPRKLTAGRVLKGIAKGVEMTILSPFYAYRGLKKVEKMVDQYPTLKAVLSRIKTIAIGVLQVAVAVAPLAAFCALAALPGGIFAFGLVLLLVPAVAVVGLKVRQMYKHFESRQDQPGAS